MQTFVEDKGFYIILALCVTAIGISGYVLFFAEGEPEELPVVVDEWGFASGGLDFDGKKESSAKNFGGGGGTGLSVQPVGFLVISHEGRVEMINVGQSAPKDTVEQIADLLERTPDIVYRLKMIFDKFAEMKQDGEAQPALQTETKSE